jgi:Ser/Thr protein kinase RdoA (MazF antagonist)
VSVSPWLPAAPRVDWAEAGALLRRFHAESAGAELPAWTPLRRLPGQVAELPAEAAGVLLAARAALLDALCELHSELGVDVLHGDLSPTNMLRTAAGPRLIDLDFVAAGPREYDLASAARRVAAGELDPGTYRAFCEAYGYDVREWEGLEVVNRLAELGGVAFRLWDARHHGRDLDWVPGVVAQWRTPL